MLRTQNINYSLLSIALIFVVSVIFTKVFVWSRTESMSNLVIDGDGRDFYSYLPDIFIEKNLGHQDTSRSWIIETPTGTINWHTAGVALLLLPFFAIGYLWASLGGYVLDGWSEPFHKMVSAGALFYTLLGLFFLRKLLLENKFSDKIVAVVLLLIFFGTNLLNYAANEASMSHAYSFSLISIFLYLSYKTFTSFTPKYLFLSALIYGLIILVRPVNAIIILALPIWSSSFSSFLASLKNIFTLKRFVISAVLFFSVVSIQSVIWIVQNGYFIQWSQKHDGFYFLDPHPLLMLFSFNNGFFIYTPLCFLLLFGLLPMRKQNRFSFVVLLMFFVFAIYLFSSYWGYTYFDGLGIRTLVDFYPLFAVMAAFLIRDTSKFLKPVIGFAGLSAVALNLLFCYQYKNGIILPTAMNSDKFNYVFLKTGDEYKGALGGVMDLTPYSENHPNAFYSAGKAFDNDSAGAFNYSGKEFGIEHRIEKIGFSTNKIFIKVNLKRKELEMNSSSEALLTVSIDHGKKNEFYQAYKMNDTPSRECCEWKEYAYQINIPHKIHADDCLLVYVWNKEKQKFLVDDFKVEVFNYNVEI